MNNVGKYKEIDNPLLSRYVWETSFQLVVFLSSLTPKPRRCP